MKKNLVILFILVSLVIDLIAQKKESEDTKSLINGLWFSNNAFKVNRIIKGIEKLNPDYESLKKIIEDQIKFPANADKGFIEWEYTLDSLDYYCMLFIPSNYDCTKKYPVTFILHGAIANDNPKSVNTYITSKSYNTDSLDRIIVYPASWVQSLWWEDKQVKNLDYIIRRLKQSYNIDENNIHLAGISDGGSGCYYLANKNITPWASIRPYIGSPFVAMEYGNQPIFLKNFSNKSFFIVNTEHDRLYPSSSMNPLINQIKQNGVDLNYFAMKGFEHNIKWLPLLEDTIKTFIKKNPRNSYPSKLYWQTNNSKDFGRIHWVSINKLSSSSKPVEINSLNEVLLPFGNGKNNPSGYLVVKVEGNTIMVETNNVKEYTLLISTDQFDFSQPIKVYTNNILSFDGKLEKRVDILLKWLSKDLDRTMLFGNELKIKL
ncbi:MAG: hypothetical protein A2W99_10780 [Bacteroidetes bacterium GWF2_33_16]|nr:MAG: hypothetical protein A2X00_04960 [Bacteroidetes bacterium GWE2_32_14]OFY04023.1 MAG: hypothetical protein A2W99_10780 [Bacteroidetes bacterium GWF2_33_16]